MAGEERWVKLVCENVSRIKGTKYSLWVFSLIIDVDSVYPTFPRIVENLLQNIIYRHNANEGIEIAATNRVVVCVVVVYIADSKIGIHAQYLVWSFVGM